MAIGKGKFTDPFCLVSIFCINVLLNQYVMKLIKLENDDQYLNYKIESIRHKQFF